VVEPTPRELREEIRAWLETATRAELMQARDLIQVLQLRRRYQRGRPAASPEPEKDRER
jgi:hypothetical protein